MRFGYWANATQSWTDLVDVAHHVERTGWDGIWYADHFMPGFGDDTVDTNECWTTLAALSQVTENVRLGQMVGCAPYRNPGLLAKITSNIDVISGGRLDWGIGAGWYQHEWDAYGYEFPSAGTRLGRLDEGVQIMRDAWRDGKVSFDGKHYQVDGAIVQPKPLQDGGLPMWIAGGGEKKTLRIAAKYAQYTNFTAEPEGFARKSQILADHCRDVGTDSSFSYRRSLWAMAVDRD